MNPGAAQKGFGDFFPYPRIVAVDNKLEELNAIRDGLQKAGLECIALSYNPEEGLEIPDGWVSDQLRIVFLDLNLFEFEDPSKNLNDCVDPIGEVLSTLAPKGPYLLILWTKHAKQVKDLMQLIAARLTDVPLPIFYDTISKQKVKPSPAGDYNLDTLCDELRSKLLKHKIFHAILGWENLVSRAATATTNRIHDLVASPQPQGLALKDAELIDTLKNFASAAWGPKNAREDPGAAITSGLCPLLHDYLDDFTSDETYKTGWAAALTGGWNRPLPARITPAILNSHCLIDTHNNSANSRGAWHEFVDNSRMLSSFWVHYFGSSYEDLISEFINTSIAGDEQHTIPLKVKIGILECTAACDHANKKTPLRRFILCSRIPKCLYGYVRWDDQKGLKPTKHDAIYRIGKISILDGVMDEFELYVDFKYTLALSSRHHLLDSKISAPIFRVRTQVLDEISTKYAAHTTRPGTYSF